MKTRLMFITYFVLLPVLLLVGCRYSDEKPVEIITAVSTPLPSATVMPPPINTATITPTQLPIEPTVHTPTRESTRIPASVPPTIDAAEEVYRLTPSSTPAPTPDINALDRDTLPPPLWEISPNSMWQATYYKWDDFELVVDELNKYYLAELIVSEVDGPRTWAVISEFRPDAYTPDYPAPFKWGTDGRSFYYTNVPAIDGCSIFNAPSSGIWKLDLETGQSMETSLPDWTFKVMSPDETLLAANVEMRRFEIIDMESGESQFFTLSIEDEKQQNYLGAMEWSPNGKHLAILKVWAACTEVAETAVFYFDLETMTTEKVMDWQPGEWHSLNWRADDEKATLQDANGQTWVLDMFSGERSRLD